MNKIVRFKDGTDLKYKHYLKRTPIKLTSSSTRSCPSQVLSSNLPSNLTEGSDTSAQASHVCRLSRGAYSPINP